jgi:hypothetical protein
MGWAFFAAGLVLDDQGRCTQTAPVLSWAAGLTRDDLREEFRRRGLRASVIGEGDRLPATLNVRHRSRYARRV